jgi:DNA (cytosine-5)-methyltransferase 1
MQQPRVLDLFSGIGGFSLGLERAGMRTVAFCEIDPYCRRVLAKHWPGVPCYDDIRTFRGTECGPVDVVCGGWPCQTFSTAARGRNVHPDMWPEFFRIVRTARPAWVVAENVPGALDGLDGIRGDLRRAGYSTAAVVCDTALPERQRARMRAIIVAHADSDGESRLSLHAEASRIRKDATGVWEPFPGTMGMDDGVPSRVDRLRALGNAVVPQIPEMIGRAIMAAHEA